MHCTGQNTRSSAAARVQHKKHVQRKLSLQRLKSIAFIFGNSLHKKVAGATAVNSK